MLHGAALTYFREVARAGSIRKAAATLNIAASAINRHVLILEQEMGAPLFDRLRDGMRLTVAGQLLLGHVTNTLHDYDRVRSAIDDLRAARTGHITIAAVDSLLVDFLPRAIDRFRADFPAVTYKVSAVTPPDAAVLVAAGDADMAFTFVGKVPPGVRFEMDIAAPIGVVMRADHPLADRPAVSLDEVARYPILTQSGPLPRGADVSGTLQAFKDSAKPRLEANSIQMLKLAVMLNMGVSFFTRFGFLHEIETGAIAWRPLTSPGMQALRLGLLVPTNRELGASAVQLSQRLADSLRRYGSV